MDFSDTTVLCIGDLMLDRFCYSDMERISPEAPVPVLRVRRTREMLGGAGNVAANVVALGGTAVLIGLIGHDPAGDRVRLLVDGSDRLFPALVVTKARPTTCKTRFIAGTQHVVRTDDEDVAPADADEVAGLLSAVHNMLWRVGAVVLSDYGKGTLAPSTVSQIVALARTKGVAVFVDPKSRDFADYLGVACLTPNMKELAAAVGYLPDSDEAIVLAAQSVMALAGSNAVLVTRSERGMTLVERDGCVSTVPSRAREVFDVSGAGDTVIATMAVCHASGMSLVQAMHVANAAAGVVVAKSGTATASVSEVIRELSANDADLAVPAASGLASLADVRNLVTGWKQRGLKVGFTNGCFDVVHPGHVALLVKARSECDRLVVALNTDDSVRALKGPTRPVNDLASRALVIAALRSVDCVLGFSETTPIELIRALMPDVLVKGADYTLNEVVGGADVLAAGGRVVLADLVSGKSTTGTIARIAKLPEVTPEF